MKVITAESSGFCYGVQRAVTICEDAADIYPGCVTLGPIIHNKHVVSELQKKGVRAVSDISGIPAHGTVIIRSHGAGKKTYEELAELGVNIVDATCPVVKRIHDIVIEESEKDRTVIIIGERDHPEVTAIAGWCDECAVFETEKELAEWLKNDNNSDKHVSVVFQTTSVETVYNSCSELIKKVCTNHKTFDTICGATSKRQREAAELSKTVDVMIVIGGKNSANNLRLADICRAYCSKVILVESPEDLATADIKASDTVGVTAGASTPAWIIKEVIQKMSEEVNFSETQADIGAGNTDSDLIPPDQEKAEEANTDTEPGIDENRDESEATAGQDEILPELDQADASEIAAQAESAAEDVEPVQTENSEVSEETAVSAGEISEAEPADAIEPAVLHTEQLEAVLDGYEPAGVTEQKAPYEGTAQTEYAPVAETFEEMLEKSIKTLHTGEKVTGVVTSITATEVSVDLGAKQSGYIPISEFADDENSGIDDIVKIGDTIEAFVMRVNDVEGMVMLSKKRLDAIKNWDTIEAAKESRAIVEGLVTEENKGGIVVNVKGVRVFVPASQTGLPKSSPMSELVKKTVKLRVTEVNQSRRRVVGSIRAVQADERREKSDRLWNEIEAGKQYDGIVKSMTSYGVFVDIGGVDGMIHISELSWTRIKQPSEVMSVGDEVSVYVLSFDKENRKISLGYKKHEDNPWTRFTKNNAVGDIVNVKIVKMMPFGAFAEIIPGVDGLIHISQITDHRIGLPSEVLSNGQTSDVKITEIDNDRKKVSLSIRALIDPASQPVTEDEAAEAIAADNTPVVVYDTDAPPEVNSDPEVNDSEAGETEFSEVAAVSPETDENPAAPEAAPEAAGEAETADALEPETLPEIMESAPETGETDSGL